MHASEASLLAPSTDHRLFTISETSCCFSTFVTKRIVVTSNCSIYSNFQASWSKTNFPRECFPFGSWKQMAQTTPKLSFCFSLFVICSVHNTKPHFCHCWQFLKSFLWKVVQGTLCLTHKPSPHSEEEKSVKTFCQQNTLSFLYRVTVGTVTLNKTRAWWFHVYFFWKVHFRHFEICGNLHLEGSPSILDSLFSYFLPQPASPFRHQNLSVQKTTCRPHFHQQQTQITDAGKSSKLFIVFVLYRCSNCALYQNLTFETIPFWCLFTAFCSQPKPQFPSFTSSVTSLPNGACFYLCPTTTLKRRHYHLSWKHCH